MNIHKLFLASLFFAACLGFAQLAPAQDAPGCDHHPCVPNPVPCAHCTGTWTDDTGDIWTVASENNPPSYGTYSVSGTALDRNPPPGCTHTTWTVTGTITQIYGYGTGGITQISWTASHPIESCGGYSYGGWTRYDGQILNFGCNTGAGTWTDSLGGSGGFGITKPADFPDLSPSESSLPVAWWSSDGTVLLYEQTIQATKNFAGREVFESPNGTPSDTCWFEGSAWQPYALTGGGWHIGYYFFNNHWYYDYIGPGSDRTNYYRDQGRVPCGAAAPQAMKMYYNQLLNSQTYFTDVVQWRLESGNWVGIARDNQWGWRTWP